MLNARPLLQRKCRAHALQLGDDYECLILPLFRHVCIPTLIGNVAHAFSNYLLNQLQTPQRPGPRNTPP